MVILKDDVWLKIAKKDELLCYRCIERRLRRGILWDDLKPCGITLELLLGVHVAHNTVKAISAESYKEVWP